MAVLVSDSFNRTDSAASLGTTDSYAGGTAQAWQVVSGGTYGISSNQAYSAVTVNDRPAYVETGVSDVKISIDVISSSGIYVTGLTFRFQDASNFFRVQTISNLIKIERRLNNAYTTILNQSLTGLTYPYTLTIEGNGSTINAYVNGVLKGTATDSNFLTATKHGLYLSNTAQRLDNFKVEDLNTGGTPTGTDGSTAFDLRPSLYSDSFAQSDVKQSVYNDSASAYDTRFNLYQDNAVLFDTLQEFFSDGIVGSIPFDLRLVLYADNSAVFDNKQAFYTDGASGADLTQQFYQAGANSADLTLVIYADGSPKFDASQTLYSDAFLKADMAQRYFTEGTLDFDTLQAILEDWNEYHEVIRLVLNITQSKSGTLGITQRQQTELKM